MEITEEAKRALKDFCDESLFCYNCPFRKENPEDKEHFDCKIGCPYKWK